MIYLDSNASTILDPRVRAALQEASDLYGNPSSLHAEGRRARRAIEEARDEVALLIGGRPGEIFFTSGGTEANAMAIFGAAAACGRPARILRGAAEHPSVREPVASLASKGWEEVVAVPEPNGAFDPDRLVRSIASAGPALVSLMLANNEYGAVYPVREAARAARETGALCHTDAVQAAGRIPVSVEELGIDLLSLSAHKLHGPKGVGALWVRPGVDLRPHTPGGGQERRMRAGTENTPGIVGFGAAARLAQAEREGDAARMRRLRDRLESRILADTPGSRVIGSQAARLPNTSAIGFEGVSGEALAIRLDLEGIAVSVGSACSSGTISPSPALLSLGFTPEEAKRVVRISLSRFTTEEEVEIAAERIPAAVREMRRAGAVPDSGVPDVLTTR